MKKFLKKNGQWMAVLCVLLAIAQPIYIFIWWAFNPDLTMMQVILKFWYVLPAWLFIAWITAKINSMA